MQLRKVNIANGPYADANIVCADSNAGHLVFMSLIGYDATIRSITKEVNKKNNMYINRMGTFATVTKGYEIIRSKHADTDYTHAIVYKKDEVVTARNGSEFISAYIYTNLEDSFSLWDEINYDRDLPDSLLDAIYDKLYLHTPVPLVREWMNFIVKGLMNIGAIRELRLFKPDDANFKVYKLYVSFASLFQIVSTGLSEKKISVEGTNEVSPEMNDVNGLDSYLNSFTGILADKIQRSFTPKFTPGVDSYSESLETFTDYASYRGLTLYDAQKAIVQSASNNLDKNNVSFIIGEMGSGSFIYIL